MSDSAFTPIDNTDSPSPSPPPPETNGTTTPHEDLFLLDDVQSLYRNKSIVVMGDSVQRCIYKDLVLSLQDTRLLTRAELKAKAETTFCNDSLLYRSELNNGRQFAEVREYHSKNAYFLVKYYFLTRCYSERMEAILQEFREDPPDLIIMNSCMWDISRYGPQGEREYYENINKLCTRFREELPTSTMLLWLTTMPIASEIASGFLLENVQFLSEQFRVAVLEANYYVTQIITAYGFDVLDLHYYMRALINHRETDGCHWDAFANRHITNLIATFLHDSWGIDLPKRTVDRFLETDLKFDDLLHFKYNGLPGFVTAHKNRLLRLAEGTEIVELDDDDEDEEDDKENRDDVDDMSTDRSTSVSPDSASSASSRRSSSSSQAGDAGSQASSASVRANDRSMEDGEVEDSDEEMTNEIDQGASIEKGAMDLRNIDE